MEDEQAYRACLDADGVLLPGRLPEPERALRVFSQRPDAMLEIGALRAHAARFFATKLGLTVDKRYRTLPAEDAARIVVGGEGMRLAYGRPARPEDHADAARADPHGSGLALLARRCPTVWLVARESEDDRIAFRIAVILASHLLGPILVGDELLGVKSARARL